MQMLPLGAMETPTATPTPDRQSTPTETVEPSAVPPIPDPRAYGDLLYLDGQTVWEGVGLASDRRVIELPFDKVQAATLSDDIMWVLADGQLAVADLTSGTVKVVAEIETSDWGSHLLAPQGQQNVFYAVGVDDSSTLLGHATHIGWYDRQAKQARLLTTLVGGVKLLGTAASGDILYAVWR